MFCADYLAAFVFHGLLSLGLAEAVLARQKQQQQDQQQHLAEDWQRLWTGGQQLQHHQRPLFHVFLGSLAGR